MYIFSVSYAEIFQNYLNESHLLQNVEFHVRGKASKTRIRTKPFFRHGQNYFLRKFMYTLTIVLTSKPTVNGRPPKFRDQLSYLQHTLIIEIT